MYFFNLNYGQTLCVVGRFMTVGVIKKYTTRVMRIIIAIKKKTRTNYTRHCRHRPLILTYVVSGRRGNVIATALIITHWHRVGRLGALLVR